MKGLLSVLLASGIVGAALAQEPPPGPMPPDGRTISPQLTTLPANAAAPAQLTPLGRLRSDEDQGPRPTDPARAPSQLTREAPSAAGAGAASSPEQGRDVATEAIAGADRCDPADALTDQSERCARILERRAAEFQARSAPELSPEQRLLASQQAGAPLPTDARTAAQRLAAGDPEDSLAAQALAAAANRPPQPEAPTAVEEAAPDALGLIIEALAGGAFGQGPNP